MPLYLIQWEALDFGLGVWLVYMYIVGLGLIYYLSQWENFNVFCWLPDLVPMKKFELFVLRWLENRQSSVGDSPDSTTPSWPNSPQIVPNGA